MNDIIHYIRHIIGICGENTHPSILFTGGLLFTFITFYYNKIINLFKDWFNGLG